MIKTRLDFIGIYLKSGIAASIKMIARL